MFDPVAVTVVDIAVLVGLFATLSWIDNPDLSTTATSRGLWARLNATRTDRGGDSNKVTLTC